MVGECEIYKEEPDALEEEMRKLAECDMEAIGRLQSSDDRYPRRYMVAADGETGREQDKKTVFHVMYGKSVTSAHMLKVSLLGVRTVPCLERDAWLMVK